MSSHGGTIDRFPWSFLLSYHFEQQRNLQQRWRLFEQHVQFPPSFLPVVGLCCHSKSPFRGAASRGRNGRRQRQSLHFPIPMVEAPFMTISKAPRLSKTLHRQPLRTKLKRTAVPIHVLVVRRWNAEDPGGSGLMKYSRIPVGNAC